LSLKEYVPFFSFEAFPVANLTFALLKRMYDQSTFFLFVGDNIFLAEGKPVLVLTRKMLEKNQLLDHRKHLNTLHTQTEPSARWFRVLTDGSQVPPC
jgi:hypothetical protein